MSCTRSRSGLLCLCVLIAARVCAILAGAAHAVHSTVLHAAMQNSVRTLRCADELTGRAANVACYHGHPMIVGAESAPTIRRPTFPHHPQCGGQRADQALTQTRGAFNAVGQLP